MNAKRLFDLCRKAAIAWVDDFAPSMGAAISYYTMFSLAPLLELWETLPGGELNFPPDYPKMPGEPPRVQPSKKVAAHWDEHGNRIEK